MSALAEFLLVRIAEDRISVALNSGWDKSGAGPVRPSPWAFTSVRLLAECEAKRLLVQRSLDVIASFGDWDAAAAVAAGGRVLWTDVNRRERAHAHDTLGILAEPYSNHPDHPDFGAAGGSR